MSQSINSFKMSQVEQLVLLREGLLTLRQVLFLNEQKGSDLIKNKEVKPLRDVMKGTMMFLLFLTLFKFDSL